MTGKLQRFIHLTLVFWHLRPTLWCVCSISSLFLFAFGFLLNYFFIGTISFIFMLILLLVQCTDDGFAEEPPEKGRSRRKR